MKTVVLLYFCWSKCINFSCFCKHINFTYGSRRGAGSRGAGGLFSLHRCIRMVNVSQGVGMWEFGGVWIHLCVCACQFGADNEDLVGTKRHIRVTALAFRAHSQRYQQHTRVPVTGQNSPAWCWRMFLAGCLPHRPTGWAAAR